MAYYYSWLRDIPSQFRNAQNIKSILKAFSRQLDEVDLVTREIVTKTTLERSRGVNLDFAGDIVNISRSEAYPAIRQSVQGSSLTDNDYRKVLQFQILKQNTNASYSDIMHGLELLWGDGAKVQYFENPNGKPASIELTTKEISSEENDPFEFKPLVIKPAGVNMTFLSKYMDKIFETYEAFKNLTIEHNVYYRYNGVYKYDGTADYYGAFKQEKIVGNATLLTQAKKKILALRYSGGTSWKITSMAFGTGLNSDGNPYTPTESMTDLKHKVITKPITAQKISDTEYKYTATLTEDDVNGAYISEIGLVDNDGMLICIKTFNKKFKESTAEMVFSLEDALS